jgi:hypothetical protein
LGLKANSADVYTKTQVDTSLGLKANTADVYTKTQVDTSLALKANSADVYNKTYIDSTLQNYALSSSIGTYFNTASLSTTDSNNYISFSGSGNTVTLNYDNLKNALGTFLTTTAASNTYLTISNAASTYLTSATAASTYATTSALANKQTTLSATTLLDPAFINTGGAGSLSSTLMGYLTTLTSNVQTQLNGKHVIPNSSNRIAALYIGTGVVDNATFAYLSGVTSSIQTQLGARATSASPVFSGNTTYATSATVDFTNCTVNNFPLTTVFACACITNNGAVSKSANRGATITPVRNGVGVVTLTLGSAHPAGVYYTVNAIAYVASSTSNPIICSVIKLPTTNTLYSILFKDHTNTAVDCDFLVSVVEMSRNKG